MTLWTIRAEYDPEARVWYSIDGDIPGLVADADTLEALAAKAGAMLPDLLEIHADEIIDETRLRGPHSIRIIAHHERDFDVAAQPAMVQGYTARVKALLREHGCDFIRSGKGDHEVWHSPYVVRPVIVDGKIMSRHSANAVLKQAGLKVKL